MRGVPPRAPRLRTVFMRGVPPRAPRLRALDQRFDGGVRNGAVVDRSAGPRSTESQAIHRLQADASVRRRLAQIDAESGRSRGGKLASADRLTRFRLADADVSASDGFRTQVGVEADDAANLGNGQIKHIGHDLHVPTLDTAEGADDIGQRGNGPANLIDARRRDVADTRLFGAGFGRRHRRNSSVEESECITRLRAQTRRKGSARRHAKTRGRGQVCTRNSDGPLLDRQPADGVGNNQCSTPQAINKPPHP